MDAIKNFAKGTVAAAHISTDTSIALTTGDGAKFPAVPFNAVWWNVTDFPDPADDPNVEVVRVTAIAVDTLTVTRAQEGTTATNKNTSAKTYKMAQNSTAKYFTDLLPGGVSGQIQYDASGVLAGAEFYRNSAGVLSIANSTTAAALQVYNTTDNNTSPVNYERGVFDWTTTANTLTIGTQKGGTGAARDVQIASTGNVIFSNNGAGIVDISGNALIINGVSVNGFRVNAGNLNVGSGSYYGSSPSTPNAAGPDTGMQRVTAGIWEFTTGGGGAGSAGYIRLNGVTVASLPTASATYKGARGTVTDATATTFLSTVAGGGANVVPVFCDGSVWKIG